MKRIKHPYTRPKERIPIYWERARKLSGIYLKDKLITLTWTFKNPDKIVGNVKEVKIFSEQTICDS